MQRSFGFVDLCGFCDFADALGDDTAAEELQILRRSVREVAPHFSVRVDKWLGDGAMLVGVEHPALVASIVAVTEVHQMRGALPLRAGIASGEVLLLEGDDYVGRPVNLAARLCDRADPGQVVASREGLRLPGWIQVDQRTKVEVRGFAKEVAVVTLTRKKKGMAREPRTFASVVEGITHPLRALLAARPGDDSERIESS